MSLLPSLPVKQRDATVRCWNIYFNTDPEYNKEEYKFLQKKMRECQFKTIHSGKGCAMIEDQPLCMGCKSANHNSFNCSFSRFSGWLGYKPGGADNLAGTNKFANKLQTILFNGNLRDRIRGPMREGGTLRGRGRGHAQRRD